MRTKNLHLVLLTLIVVVGGSVFLYMQTRPEESVSTRTSVATIRNFNQCVQAGNPIMESNPRQCRTSSGALYVEGADETEIDTVEYASRKGTRVSLSQPLSKSVLASPVAVKGVVPGNWSFEGSFPVTLLDSSGITIAQATAKVSGDWMTEDYVPFEATLTFDTPMGGGKGTLILKKDNPSGDANNDDSVLIPISF
jgi:hypothetical protein